MSKIKVLVGCSNSGKSTYTSKLVQEHPEKYISVNRDKIRELLFSYTEDNISEYYNRKDISKLEKQVTLYEDTLINEGLCQGKTVIVDATHLSVEYIERHKFWNVPIEIVWFDVTLKEALTRNMGRKRKVDEEIIKKQYNKYIQLRKEYLIDFIEPISFKNNRHLPPCIIYDIDGTIAKMNGRGAYDWDKVDQDLVVSEVCATIDWVSDLKEIYRPTVLIVSGRDEEAMEKTEKWLDENGIYCDRLIMRSRKDIRADWIIKEEIWRNIAKEFYIVGMYDDRNQVVRRARALGLKVFQVEYGNF